MPPLVELALQADKLPLSKPSENMRSPAGSVVGEDVIVAVNGLVVVGVGVPEVAKGGVAVVVEAGAVNSNILPSTMLGLALLSVARSTI